MSKNQSNDAIPKHLKKDTKYYLYGGDLYLLASQTLFRVHSFFFVRESVMFREWLSKPVDSGQVGNGKSVDTAILLDNVEPEDFQKFLWCFYNPKYSLYDETVENWTIILRLAHHWNFTKVKELTIRELQKKDMQAVDRLLLYQEYDVDKQYLTPLYAQLCAQEDALSIPDCLKLGVRATAVIFQARERLRANPEDGGKSPLPDKRRPDVLTTVEEIFSALPPPSPTAGKLPNGNAH